MIPVLRAAALAVTAGLAVLAAGCGSDPERVSTENAPRLNILFIMMDDLGYGDLGEYGGATCTPNMDALAREGMRFTHYYTAGTTCTPTRSSILTGRYPLSLGFDHAVNVDRSYRGIADSFSTLPEVLGSTGYRTMHVGKWHVGNKKDRFKPSAKGYDRSIRLATEESRLRRRGYPWYLDTWLEIDDVRLEHLEGRHSTEVLTTETIGLLEEHLAQGPDRPFFLSLWYRAVHREAQLPVDGEFPDRCGTPLCVDSVAESARQDYMRLVCYVDDQIGRILRRLRELGLEGSTLVVVTSDNGGEKPPVHETNGPLTGYKGDLFEGGLRVPLIVRWPGRVAPAKVNESIVSSLDLFPTFAELAGADVSGLELDGESRTDTLLKGVQVSPSAPLFWEHRETRRPFDSPTGIFNGAAVRHGPWKLVVKPVPGEEPEMMLYNIAAEPSEAPEFLIEDERLRSEMYGRYLAWRHSTSVIDHRIDFLSGAAAVNGQRVTFEGAGVVALARDDRFDFHDGHFSVRVRIKPTAPTNGRQAVILEKKDSWRLALVNDRIRLTLFSESGMRTDVLGDRPLPADRWSDLVVTIYSWGSGAINTVSLYQNNEPPLVQSAVGSVRSNDNAVQMGSIDSPFVGELEGLTFHVVSLVPDQI